MTHFSGRTPPFPVGWLLVSETGRVGQILDIRRDWVVIRTKNGELWGVCHQAVLGIFKPPASPDNFDVEFERRVQEVWA